MQKKPKKRLKLNDDKFPRLGSEIALLYFVKNSISYKMYTNIFVTLGDITVIFYVKVSHWSFF